jgi:hypothetical protein
MIDFNNDAGGRALSSPNADARKHARQIQSMFVGRPRCHSGAPTAVLIAGCSTALDPETECAEDADIRSPSPSLSVLRQVDRCECQDFEAIHNLVERMLQEIALVRAGVECAVPTEPISPCKQGEIQGEAKCAMEACFYFPSLLSDSGTVQTCVCSDNRRNPAWTASANVIYTSTLNLPWDYVQPGSVDATTPLLIFSPNRRPHCAVSHRR